MEAKQRILEATQSVICQSGLSNLSIQRIADELDQSKSAVYYHYESKHDLIISFLDYLHDHLKETIKAVNRDDPEEALQNLIAELSSIQNNDERNLRVAIMSLRAEAPHDEHIAKRFQAIDKTVQSTFEDLYRSMNVQSSEQAASLTVSAIDGVVNRSLGYQLPKDNIDLLDGFPQRFT